MRAMAVQLEVVQVTHPDPPYPPDIRAKGWQFSLDLERVKQSTTWKLVARDAPDLRPWLIMLWAESWTQVPCGTLPADDDEIALVIGMPPNLFAAHKNLLLRGWQRCSDGRLYHRVVTELVLQMMGKRKRDRERKHLTPKDSTGAARIPSDSTAGTGTGTGTGTVTGTVTGEVPRARAVDKSNAATAQRPKTSGEENSERQKQTAAEGNGVGNGVAAGNGARNGGKQDPQAWMRSPAQAAVAGLKFGITQRQGEQLTDFVDRIIAAMRAAKQQRHRGTQ